MAEREVWAVLQGDIRLVDYLHSIVNNAAQLYAEAPIYVEGFVIKLSKNTVYRVYLSNYVNKFSVDFFPQLYPSSAKCLHIMGDP